MMHLRDEPPRLTLFNPALPETLERIVHKVMAKEPSARYRTADQLGRILISYRERGDDLTGAQPATNTPPAPPAPRLAPQPPARPTIARPPEILVEAPTVYRQPTVMVASEATVRGEPAEYGPALGLEGIDWVAMTLGFLAFIAIAGLIPFWAYVLSVISR
jgi:hypothetical protein